MIKKIFKKYFTANYGNGDKRNKKRIFFYVAFVYIVLVFGLGSIFEKRVEIREDKNILLILPGGVKLELIKINAGTFMMGTPDDGSRFFMRDEILHQVTLTKDYWIGKYEVTVDQWMSVMGEPVIMQDL